MLCPTQYTYHLPTYIPFQQIQRMIPLGSFALFAISKASGVICLVISSLNCQSVNWLYTSTLLNYISVQASFISCHANKNHLCYIHIHVYKLLPTLGLYATPYMTHYTNSLPLLMLLLLLVLPSYTSLCLPAPYHNCGRKRRMVDRR